MNHEIVAITGKPEADIRLLTHVFQIFKANRMNLRKIEFMQGTMHANYLHLELDVAEDLPHHMAALNQVRGLLVRQP